MSHSIKTFDWQTVIDEFPRNQTLYNDVNSLLEDMIQLVMTYVSQGHQSDEIMPANLLDTAGNLVDVVSSDLDSVPSTETEDVTERRQTIQRTLQQIDRIMIMIFSVRMVHCQHMNMISRCGAFAASDEISYGGRITVGSDPGFLHRGRRTFRRAIS
jgi:hypothetical protein